GGGLEQQRGVGGGVHRLEAGDGLDVAGVGDDGGQGAELFELAGHVGVAVWQRRKRVLSPIHRGPAVLVSARTIASGSRYPDACEHTGTLMADSDKRIALLIDADNAPAAKIDAILNEVARHGVVNVRRAYGNWKSQNLMGWEKVLHEYAIRPIQQFAYSPGQNASDMAMAIDSMDLMY